MNEVAVGPSVAIGVPTRSILLIACTFDFREDRDRFSSSMAACNNGTGATSGYDRTVVNVALAFLEDSCPEGRGLAVELDPTDDRDVGGLDTRLSRIVGPSALVSWEDTGPAGIVDDELAMAFEASCMMMET
jgi:hypothetical protein